MPRHFELLFAHHWMTSNAFDCNCFITFYQENVEIMTGIRNVSADNEIETIEQFEYLNFHWMWITNIQTYKKGVRHKIFAFQQIHEEFVKLCYRELIWIQMIRSLKSFNELFCLLDVRQIFMIHDNHFHSYHLNFISFYSIIHRTQLVSTAGNGFVSRNLCSENYFFSQSENVSTWVSIDLRWFYFRVNAFYEIWISFHENVLVVVVIKHSWGICCAR